jgi:1-acyl-sn-glycerol-3-phosphate acyltransferase
MGRLESALGLLVGLGLFYAALPWLVRPFWWLVMSPRYRVRVWGIDHVPGTGPALLVANHVTWIDGFLLVATCPRRARFLVNANYINLPLIRHLAWRAGMIPVPASGPRAQRAAITAARSALDRGEAVAIFPEGQLSRNGLPGSFRRGLEAILANRREVPVIPVYLDNLWGSIFSHAGGRFFSHWPRGRRHRVGIGFGPPVPPPVTAASARQAVVEAGVRAFELRDPADQARPLETIDPTLPHLDHPTLGRIAASTPDFDQDGVAQVGHKPGSVGLALPGTALRPLDHDGRALPPETPGRLHVLRAGDRDWIDTGLWGQVDRDGFVILESPGDPNGGIAQPSDR